MSGAAAWLARQPRTWVALGAAATATALASGDGRAGWTGAVALATFSLAGLSMRMHWQDAGSDSSPSTAKHDERVAEILRRYEDDYADRRRRAARR